MGFFAVGTRRFLKRRSEKACIFGLFFFTLSLSLEQVVQIHQETVDLYLEDVILETVERTADEQAREEIRKKVKEVNDIAYALEER